MRGPRRRGLLLAVVGAALLSTPGGTRGARRAEAFTVAREYATVGRVLTRRVDGRTVVLIPVKGPVRPRLSEPFKVGNRWRLYLTLEGARVGIIARPRVGEGVLDLTVEETGSDVRISVDVAQLTTYGTKPSEEGLLLWLEDDATAEHRAEEQARALPIIGDGPRLASQDVAPEPEPEGAGWIRLALLLAAAAGAGLGFRWLRRRGTMPAWLESAGAMVGSAFLSELRNKVLGGSTETDDSSETEATSPATEPDVEALRKTG